MSKKVIDVKGLGGIDTRHTRDLSHFSAGKNFLTQGDALKTRNGCSEVASSFAAPVIALFKAGMPTITTRLLAQEGRNLHHLVDGSWSTLKSDLTAGKRLRGCRLINRLILVNGPERLSYDIPSGILSSLVVPGDTQIPNLEYVVTWKFRVFGWAPNYAGSNYLRFCGSVSDAEGGDPDDFTIDPTVWPPDFTLDISGDAGAPLLMALPFGNHLLCLAKNNYWMVYGNTEEDFQTQYGGTTNVHSPETCSLVGSTAFWLGVENDKPHVYAYTGTEPEPISAPVDELLADMSLSNVVSFSFQSQYWLVFRDDTKSTAFIFDLDEKEWYIYEFPFIIESASAFGSYLGTEYLYLGLANNKIAKVDDSTTDMGTAITTEMKIGPFEASSMQFKSRTLYLNAEPNNAFNLDVYIQVDDKPEKGPKSVTFAQASGMVIKSCKLGKLKARSCNIRLTTTDRIDELQKISIVVSPRAVK